MVELYGVPTPTNGPEYDKGLVVVVHGFDPIPKQLDPVIGYFSLKNDVWSYKYSNDVVTSGDPHQLPALITQLSTEVEEIAKDYNPERVRMVGASLGACIAMNVQDRLNLPMPGVYATAGVNVAKNFMKNPVFRVHKVPQLMEQNGYTYQDVADLWSEIDIHDQRVINPDMRFWASASMLDPVVWYPLAKRNLQRFGGNHTLHKSYAIGHTNAINEVVAHIAEATEQADSIK